MTTVWWNEGLGFPQVRIAAPGTLLDEDARVEAGRFGLVVGNDSTRHVVEGTEWQLRAFARRVNAALDAEFGPEERGGREPGEAEMAAEYDDVIDLLMQVGVPAQLLQTGNGCCFVLQVELADGSLVQIGSDAGPLGRPWETGRVLEAVYYESLEATGGTGCTLCTAAREDPEAMSSMQAILLAVHDAKLDARLAAAGA